MKKNVKFVFYAAFSDYWRIMNNDLFLNDEVFVCEGVKIQQLNQLNKLHNSWKLNRYFEIPFKSIWFSLYTASDQFDKNEKQFAIFPEDNSLSYSKKYLKFLRQKYPKLVIIFSFSNTCGEYNIKKLNTVKKYYDHIVTFNEADSIKYGFEHLPVGGFSQVTVPEADIKESDVFFVGQDKGRLPLLLQIYERLSVLGLKCDFYITGVKDESIVQKDGITYNHRLSYIEVLQHVNKTKCILELLEGDSNYCSIRTGEALIYHKKLITMSSSVLKYSFYSPSQIMYIHSPGDITKTFFDEPIDTNYDIEGLSPLKSLKEIEKLERVK